MTLKSESAKLDLVEYSEEENVVQLETVEDFEKVKRALEDLKSTPRDYCVCPYSYCWYCDEVREFEAPCVVSCSESINVMCLGCKKAFFVTDIGLIKSISWGNQFVYDKILEQFRNEMKRLNSREMQKNFFAVVLEKRIAKEKSELRKVKDTVQKFAQFRS